MAMNLESHPYTLRQLQYAVAVADTLSFRKAAELCHVSQPSLSAQLAQLESALGVRLFERNRKRVLPTEAGRELVRRARQILIESDDLVVAAKQLGDPLTGTLRMGVIPTISPYLLPRITPVLRERYPKLTINWVEDKTDVLLRSLDSGKLDAVLLALEADIGDVEREIVARDPFVLATPPGHPLGATASPAEPGDLQGTSVLLLDDGHCFRDQALAVCSSAKARELEFRATSLSTLAQMVAGGGGVTLLPALAVPTEAGRAGLTVRPFAEPAPSRTIALAWRRTSPLGEALKRLAATIREAYPTIEKHAARQPAHRKPAGGRWKRS
ncbi:MAG: LysR substrate-binding domain-containing protein [Nitrospirota bacterium]